MNQTSTAIHSSPVCPHDQRELKVIRTRKNVYLYCRSCNRKFSVNELSESMTEYLEDCLASIPCDRF